jgi:hypothetical protein
MATLSKGQTFGATETVTNTKLHDLVDNGSISGILNADCDASMELANSKLADITEAGKVSGSSMFNLASIPSGAGTIPMEQLTNSVLLATLQTIPSLKYFATLPILSGSDPTDDEQAVRKAYVDTKTAFGSYESKNNNTDYQASTDGFFIGYLVAGASASAGRIVAYSDSNSTPTTVRGGCHVWVNTGAAAESASTNYSSFCIPVKSGEYYKGILTTHAGTNAPTATYFWMPFGA